MSKNLNLGLDIEKLSKAWKESILPEIKSILEMMGLNVINIVVKKIEYLGEDKEVNGHVIKYEIYSIHSKVGKKTLEEIKNTHGNVIGIMVIGDISEG